MSRRSRHPWRWLVLTAVVALVVTVQLTRGVPPPSVRTVAVAAETAASSDPPRLPWPATGQGALAVPARGLLVQSGPETPVPIASLTKIMTAYLVLRDHPLTPAAAGPGVTLDADDQNEAAADADADATSVPVQVGEVLSERQLLNGLLVHSANNFADVLAKWDSGTVAAFVARMNATAEKLGMGHTHYADANGLSPASTSTAADQLRVAQAAMAIPTFATVVSQTSITLPIAGVIPNYVTSIGTDGIVGVKSGFTQAAMGCLVMAADRTVDGHSVLVMAAVTGQTGLVPLDAANAADVSLVDAAAAVLHDGRVLADDTPAATVVTAWRRGGVPAVTTRAVTLLTWPGDHVRFSFAAAPVALGARAGVVAGTLAVSDGVQHVAVPVRTTAPVTGPTLWWKLHR